MHLVPKQLAKMGTLTNGILPPSVEVYAEYQGAFQITKVTATDGHAALQASFERKNNMDYPLGAGVDPRENSPVLIPPKEFVAGLSAVKKAHQPILNNAVVSKKGVSSTDLDSTQFVSVPPQEYQPSSARKGIEELLKEAEERNSVDITLDAHLLHKLLGIIASMQAQDRKGKECFRLTLSVPEEKFQPIVLKARTSGGIEIKSILMPVRVEEMKT